MAAGPRCVPVSGCLFTVLVVVGPSRLVSLPICEQSLWWRYLHVDRRQREKGGCGEKGTFSSMGRVHGRILEWGIILPP